MIDNKKTQLEKLLKNNKVKLAKRQLIRDLIKYHDIDVSGKEFVDYQTSEEVRKRVYNRIRRDQIKAIQSPYDVKTLISNIEFIFDMYKHNEDKVVWFYPSTYGFRIRSSDQLYLEYPLAISLQLSESKDLIIKLMLEMQDDLVVVSEELNFGFVLSVDEYSYVTIEYWGI
ncbi:hypothetical protein [Halobacillus yeomjeoni]|uniref:Uncharacterized protein n=1 Tax=Halobacillus yeomjeoni TaxID=311194 RepID=A0A931HXS0_9BACI|nr:hypothetical protein [Halobacillus yeomjeoni]MBH0231396.1 hypothetical protein [Halobacillus yeomjeoni]